MDDLISKQRKIVTDLRDRVEHDYDGLIEELRTNGGMILVADVSDIQSQLSMPLWKVNREFHDFTTSMRHPTREIIDMHSQILDTMKEPIQAMHNTPSFDPMLANEITQDVAFVS